MAASSTNGRISDEAPRQDSRGTAPPLVRAQPPALPTGGGAVRGIGEKFSANASTGTGSLTIPIAITPARGFGPELALHYDSGAGNGPFGAGWRLSVPTITRKTDKQLPTYLDADEADIFVMSGIEDLVPIPGGDAGVRWYRPRVEGGFARIERHTGGGATWWVTITAANVRNTYGQSAAARIADPQDPRRIFSWLLERTEDARGNVAVFDYVAEDVANVAPGPCEQHRLDGTAPITNAYLSAIRYGHKVDDPSRFAFAVVLDYGNHAPGSPAPTTGLWPARRDAFSSYRAGFEIRTYRRCQRIQVFHDFPELGPTPRLVRSVELTYDDDPALSHLIAFEQRGYDEAGAMLAVPAVKLAYTQAITGDQPRTIEPDAFGDLAGGVDGKRHQWIDLDAEGVPGVITRGDGVLHYRRNLGDGQLGPARPLALAPVLAAPAAGQQLMDLGGDGRMDLVAFGPPLPGFSERVPANGGDGDWEPLQPFASLPQIEWTDPDVRFLDLDGDGLDDVLIAKDDSFVWYPSLGKAGFGPPRVLPRPSDEERGPAIVFADSRHTIALADLSGDGLRDLVRLENGCICYWPNLGRGTFGAKVTMGGAPLFDAPDQFEATRVLFADIDGTGTSDVLYAAGNGVRYWLNLAGNAWSEPHDVALPPDHSAASVTAADVLGGGTACLVWSSAVPGDSAIRYVDLMGGVKPHLLAQVDNQLGLTTRVEYATSTAFYLADRAVGTHWKTQLPFPVHVVARVEVDDAIRRVRFVSEYRYRDGYFDGCEREFRGFGYVEQTDTESDPAQLGIGLFADRPPPINGEYAQPPVVTKTWFHTGVWLDEGPSGRIVIDPGLTTDESRDAYRALRGHVLRQEIYANDGPLADVPFVVTESSYAVRRLWPAVGGAHGVFASQPRETITTHSERAAGDARVQHALVLDVDDCGHPRRSVAIGYPSAAPDARLEQRKLLATLSEIDLINVVDQPAWYRHGVPLEARTFELVGLHGGTPLTFDQVKAVADAAVAIAYDAQPPAGASKRLVERTRTRYYDSNAIPEALPFGQIDRRALAYGSFGLAFTPSLLASLYGARVSEANLREGGYLALDDDPGNWWVPSGRALPDPAKFYLPTSYVDPFGNATALAYDAHVVAVASVTDARNNSTFATTDYRVMAPVVLTDVNGNQSQVAFDALGRVTSLWITGKSGEGDPVSGDPTMRCDYAFYDPATRRPSVAHSQARETHGAATTKWQHAYTYTDGAGQIVMTKAQAEPGVAKQRQADGTCIDVAANPRWVGNGRTVFDNKGNPIKQYEPYFSVTADYEDEDDLVCQGVTPLLHYDPIGRLIGTEYPDGSTKRVEFTPWQQASYDRNDTVLDAGNVWHARAVTGSPAERRAATSTEAHANTPTRTLFDTLGRAFSVTADNGGGDLLETRTTFDIEGNPLVVTDALGRACLTRAFTMLGQACHQVSIDAGERWSLADVLGQPLRRWDGRGQTIATTYDVLRRPVGVIVTLEGGAPILAETTVWGEDAPGTVPNARGRAYQRSDGAGVATSEAYDFKGNVLSSRRQLVADYTKAPDWSGSPPLDSELFRFTTEYDALNRPTRMTSPDGSVLWPGYNEAALLDTVDVQIRGAAERTSLVANIDYNEMGQRTQIAYGNAATTRYGYDPLTLRLSALQTTRRSDGRALQDLAYTYDPVGNAVQIGDAVQQPVFYNGSVVDGTALYVYEPAYRLSSAEAREHAGGLGGPRTDVDIPVAPLPHPNDGQALIPYRETYQYDKAGNIQLISHGAAAGAAAWTSPMRYVANTNRLDQTMVPGDQATDAQWHGRYTYDAHGNMMSMPHLATIDWDWKDQMQRADRGGGGAVYFTYDGSGERVRKVWEHGGTIDERIYLGGYEIHRRRTSGAVTLERETLHVMDGVKRLAMVETKTIDTSVSSLTPTPVIRFQLGNHLGSAMLELDATGGIISYEEYHPFGTSAYRAASAIEVSEKRYRYLGNERDEETGLDHHGARCCASWLGRWTSADPAGLIDGPNLYAYARDNPIRLSDPGGRQSTVTIIDEVTGQDEYPEGWQGPDPHWQDPDQPPTKAAPASGGSALDAVVDVLKGIVAFFVGGSAPSAAPAAANAPAAQSSTAASANTGRLVDPDAYDKYEVPAESTAQPPSEYEPRPAKPPASPGPFAPVEPDPSLLVAAQQRRYGGQNRWEFSPLAPLPGTGLLDTFNTLDFGGTVASVATQTSFFKYAMRQFGDASIKPFKADSITDAERAGSATAASVVVGVPVAAALTVATATAKTQEKLSVTDPLIALPLLGAGKGLAEGLNKAGEKVFGWRPKEHNVDVKPGFSFKSPQKFTLQVSGTF